MAGGKQFEYNNPFVKWLEYRLPIISFVRNSLGDGYPAPKNLSFMWSFGVFSGLMLMIQLLTGIVLVMHYTPHADMAFDSVEHIMREVNWGWMLRYMHANGASFFFIVVYIHMFRGLYYGSYKAPRELLWMIGVVIFIVMMATAFMGYVLPWGQMSFWGATVITNLFTAFPIVGEPILTLLLGGFSADNPTLNRFFSLHYLLPFVLVGIVVLHVWALHQHGSNNPLGIDVKDKESDCVPFHPYFTVKDLFSIAVFLLIFCYFVFFAPNVMGHPDNYIKANPLSTPAHIVPEWYFLPFYAILRSVPDKLLGVLLMFGSLLILLALPWLDTSKVRSAKFRPVYRWFFLLFLVDCVVLTFCGANNPEGVWLILGQLGTVYYFGFFLVILPLLGWFEKPLPVPTSIAQAVLDKANAKSGQPAAAE